jgi:hypothetical protein
MIFHILLKKKKTRFIIRDLVDGDVIFLIAIKMRRTVFCISEADINVLQNPYDINNLLRLLEIQHPCTTEIVFLCIFL